MIRNYWNKGSKQKRNTIILGLINLIALFVLREDYQFALLFIRKFIFVILLSGIVLFFGLRKFRSSRAIESRGLPSSPALSASTNRLNTAR